MRCTGITYRQLVDNSIRVSSTQTVGIGMYLESRVDHDILNVTTVYPRQIEPTATIIYYQVYAIELRELDPLKRCVKFLGQLCALSDRHQECLANKAGVELAPLQRLDHLHAVGKRSTDGQAVDERPWPAPENRHGLAEPELVHQCAPEHDAQRVVDGEGVILLVDEAPAPILVSDNPLEDPGEDLGQQKRVFGGCLLRLSGRHGT